MHAILSKIGAVGKIREHGTFRNIPEQQKNYNNYEQNM